MTFAHPHWFYGLALLPLLVFVQIAADSRRRKLVRQLVASRLESQLAGTASQGKRWLRLALVLLGLAAVFVTLAQPRWGVQSVAVTTRGRDIIIAIDTSRSMLANDLAPSRLARVKLAAEDLITECKGDRIGLVAFAGTAFLQAPLTADSGAVLASLHELDTEIIPRGGTNIADAIHTAMDAFGKGESEDRAIVLFTDGEELDADGVAAAKELNGTAKIFTVGAGSPDGTIIAVRGDRGQTDFIKDPQGEIVKSKLDEDRLRAIAEAAGGFYIRLQSGPPEMERIRREGLMQLRAHDEETRTTRKEIERYQYPLAVALFFLIASLFIGDRRRGIAFAALLFSLPAGAWASNPGLESYRHEDYAGAIQHFEKELKRLPKTDALQFDIGTAAYKSGQLDKALEAFSNAIRTQNPGLREKAEYNLGNTLFQRGSLQKERPTKVQDWKNALQHYEEALKTDPADANAVHNRDVVRKLLEEEEKEQKKEDQKKDEEKQDQQKKDDQKKKGDKSEQEKGQGQGDPEKQDGQQSGDKDQQGEPKDQQGDKPEDGKDGSKGDQKDGKQGDKKDQKSQNGDASQKKDNVERGKKEGQEEDSQGDPTKDQPQPKRTGDIEGTRKGEPTDKGKEEQAAAEAERRADEIAAAEGKMTEAQARSLLDSLKNEDDRVRLLVPKNDAKDRSRMLRDW